MTFVDEVLLAARGVFAILTGRRNAPDYFDFSRGGLAGSFVAFFLATGLAAFVPLWLGIADPANNLHAWQAILSGLVLYVVQLGFATLVLRQFSRLDGLIPYVVADNWATFFVTLLSLVIGFAGLSGDVSLVVLGILILVIEINTARLIVTLSPLQIAAFIIAQMVGVFVGLMLVGSLLPIPAPVS